MTAVWRRCRRSETDDGLHRYDGYRYTDGPGVDHSTASGLRALLTLGTFLVAAPVIAQAPDLRFERISIDQGLSQNSVYAMLQDRMGFLWIGTDDGLNRYDGYRFEVLRSSPGGHLDSLSENRIRALCEDRDGILWIGTRSGGLNRYDRRSRTSTRFRHDPAVEDSLGADRVWVIHQDRGGTLWVGTDGGLDHFEPEQAGTFNHLRHDPADPTSLGHDLVRILHEDRAGNLWAGTRRGLNRLDAATRTMTRYVPLPETVIADYNSIVSIHEDRRGRLWIGTWRGLMRFDQETSSFTFYGADAGEPYGPSHSIQDIHEDPDGTLWLATNGRGILFFDPESETFRSRSGHHPMRPTSLSGDRVTVFLQDRSGTFWAGTSADGLNKRGPAAKAFAYYRSDPTVPWGLADDMITAIHEDEERILWLGTRNGGLHRIERDPVARDRRGHRLPAPPAGAVEHFRADPNDPGRLARDDVRSILEDSSNVLWVGTEAGGLHRFDGGAFTRYQHDVEDPATLRDNDVWVLFEDSAGNLWVGTYGGGLSRHDPSTDAFRHYFHDQDDPGSLSHDVVRAIHQDAGGALWVGTGGGGLNRLEPDHGELGSEAPRGPFRRYRHDPRDPGSLSSDEVLSILEDHAGTLWIGTHGGGLNRLLPASKDGGPENTSFRFYTEADGLPSNVVYGILEDQQSRLWMSTNRGLSRFDPPSETFRNYDVADGLQSREFNSGAYFLGPQGEMFFGGIHGLNAFFPADIEDNPYVPPVVLTSYKKFNQEVPLDTDPALLSTVTLRHDESVFSFEVAALSYAAQHKNQYAYRLLGFRDQWTQLGTKREAGFTNLDPGAYTLEVRASNNDGVWNEAGLSIEVIVEPPFWRTWWFQTATAFAAAGLLWGGYLARTRSIRRHNRALAAEIVERRRAEEGLAANNAELEVKNAEMERFIYTVSHDLKTPLVTIKGFLGYLERDADAVGSDPRAKERVSDDVTRIGRAADTMHHLLEDLLELSRIGRLMNPPEVVALTELAEKAVELVAGRITERGLAVTPEGDQRDIWIDPAMPVVEGDQLRLLEIYQNLIDNAVKFLGDQPAPRIEIGARPDSGQILCWVKDNGAGIDPRYLDKVFGLFERLDQQVPGTGVGLALVKRIVEVHGGRAWVESEGVGRGCTFFFTLPQADSPRTT